MRHREQLAQDAVKAALRLRVQHRRPLDQPISPVDLALDMGICVRFEPISSLEGMYSPDGPDIVLGSLRPSGRRNYTCGHEIGHHAFGHGMRVDELADAEDDGAGNSDEEYVANRFSAALLMPKLAVERVLAARSWNAETCRPEDIYVLAGVFGVGYSTMVGYLQGTLRLLSAAAAERLRTHTPKSLRRQILGTEVSTGLVVAGEDWNARPIDVEVADLVLLPQGTQVTGNAVVCDDSARAVWRAVTPGVAIASVGRWTNSIRVARTAYRGLAEYRHLEDPDDVE